MRYICLWFMLLFAGQKSWSQPANDINRIFDRYWEERMRLFPMEATQIGDNRYNGQNSEPATDAYNVQPNFFKTPC